ncbi:MAG: hypothetical protein BECKG1743D_GA0114223_100032 [Candidatus Kentron sp. G]|nr:MAG: hypothetical protein BECKG1743F_GA0114225_100342 [Candidatus Kentron sp. G]VFM95530.1 MAG: hypothetical protein BECKG1743E_GA0114224_100062 [Candidatus Kentron sp. G]VFM97094.1 MAG: hypothetical protein BECKG1743D_GA0114223_100032 [Candidatus Kentron sp. G]
MTAITFDTLKFVRTLRDAQFNEYQAEAISRAFQGAQDESKAATQAELREIDNKLDKLRSQIREVELRLTIHMGAMLATAIAILVAIDRFLPIPAT